MTKPKFLTPKFIDYALRYVVYFLCVALTPFLAKPIAPLFDFIGYGLMNPVFVEVFTMIFWALEWVAIFTVERKMKEKKCAAQETETNCAQESEEGKPTKCKLPLSFKIRPPLSLKNVMILTVISVVCIFILSAVIGFEVKPIYDLGEKIEGYDLYNKFAWLGKRAMKCFWILGMIKACKGMAEEIVTHSAMFENKQWMRWVIQVAILLIFALFDVFVESMLYPSLIYPSIFAVPFERMMYPLTLTKLLVAFTYLLFYGVFVPVQALTEGSDTKAFLLILLIYMF